MFAIPLDFDFFKHPNILICLEYLISRLELNSSKNVILVSNDTTATYKLLEMICELCG